ncbi:MULTISPECIES: hypothetical protein [unclassified Saccharothrix]|uniref:hypothetical protein n=1 Tax=unclassified Saccharothrix TaxID=2593673 RepID=UPI00307E35A0
MAVSDAARRSGSLLLRALAVGGFAVTAWLLSGGVAAADDQDHPDVGMNPLDAVNLAVDGQQTATTALLDALAARTPDGPPPHVLVPALDEPLLAAPGLDETLLIAPVLTAPAAAPIALPVHPLPVEVPTGEESDEDAPVYEYDDEDTRDVEYSHTGGTHSTTAPRSIANALPPEQYQAKVAAKAAARLAAQAPPAEAEQAPPPAVVEQDVAPSRPAPRQAAEPDRTTPTWENPQPFTPTPAPQQAPAPTAPTSASASGHDGSQGHRGGGIASHTGQDRFAPPALWRVEQRDDRRAPGSIPGLPSTSPD